LTAYPEAFKQSWLYEELHQARNFKPWMAKGLKLGSIMFGIDQMVFGGKAPWTLHQQHARPRQAETWPPIVSPSFIPSRMVC
jgi:electron-transferring-flavoprotein dehydrogenase